MVQVLNRFKASMEGLESGDIIICNRQNETLHSVVLERREEKGHVFFKLSSFSTILCVEAYPKDVFWDAQYGWLSDTGGRLVLLSEEWVSTEKGTGKTLLAQMPTKKHDLSEKARAIYDAMKNRRKSLEDNAKMILNELGQESPPKESVKLLEFALTLAAKRVWNK